MLWANHWGNIRRLTIPRVDRDFSGAERISQIDILRAEERDDTDQVEPPDDKPDHEWNEDETSSGTFAPKIGDLLKLQQS